VRSGQKQKTRDGTPLRFEVRSWSLDQLSKTSRPRMGHIGHAQVIVATIESTEVIGSGYTRMEDGVKRRLRVRPRLMTEPT